MKYTETKIVYREFPDEVTLAFNISGCPFACPGCHTPKLQTDIGTELTKENLIKEINKHINFITCIGFMGGDADVGYINSLCGEISEHYKTIKKVKFGIYSGSSKLDDVIGNMSPMFDYVKVGPFVEKLGPIDSKTSNQKMYRRNPSTSRYEDITDRMRDKIFF